jgi:transcription initiation factor TFIIIB Brf1 subunit/transcription initiation factor TFIIB
MSAKYLAGKDLTKLSGDELDKALKEELKLRKKELNKDISFQDVINFRTPELVGEYVGQCIQWMKEQEEQFKIENNYIDNPPAKKIGIRKKMVTHKLTRQDRALAVDLVIEIHRKYGLVPETLFVAVSTIDRYLGIRKEGLKRAKDIEAIGVAALLIASKYEDIYPPALDEMIKMMNRPSTRKELLEWEFKILKELVFQITVPTPFRFLERFSAASMVYQNAFPLAQYIIELALYDYDIVYNLKPSEIAAVALFAAANFDIHSNKLAPKQKWSSEVSNESSMKKPKIIEYFNTYFVDLAFRVERELKVNDITIKYPQYQFVDEEPLGLFNPIK